jgi:endonuclease YncB( thermonuclease family)
LHRFRLQRPVDKQGILCSILLSYADTKSVRIITGIGPGRQSPNPQRRSLALLAVALTLAVPPAAADGPPTVVAADDLRLADGRGVRLAGVHVPPGDEAMAAVAGWLGQGALRLEPEPPPLDRHGRLRAQVRAAGGVWLQGELVRQGMAVVAPAADVPGAVIEELLGLERAARAAGRGLWATGAIGPWPAARVAAAPGAYVLVRGRVRGVARAQEFVYLNFGEDWRRDFTARAAARDAARFARQGLDLERLEGQEVLVRGHLLEANGPMIELVHLAQIEVMQ